MNVSANIKRRREQLGISQMELAKRVQVSACMINQIERGTKNPSLQLGVLIAEALRCEVSDLVS